MNPGILQGENRVRWDFGFTLVELFIVIAVLAVLSVMFLPVFAGTKTNNQAFQCINNLRQLQRGWLMYSADNNDNIVRSGGLNVLVTDPNDPEAKPGGGKSQWVLGDMAGLPSATNTALLEAGLLYPYAPSLAIYKCPADRKTVSGMNTVRSISMNAWMNPISDGGTELDAFNYFTFRKQSDILTPSMTWLMIDENPNSINDGWFIVRPNPPTVWRDLPAVYHDRAAGLSFTDGHVEIKRWTDARVIAQAGAFSRRDPNSSDLDWLIQRSTTKIQP